MVGGRKTGYLFLGRVAGPTARAGDVTTGGSGSADLVAVMLNEVRFNELEVHSVCFNLGASGWQVALSVAGQAGITDEAKAAAAVRKAV